MHSLYSLLLITKFMCVRCAYDPSRKWVTGRKSAQWLLAPPLAENARLALPGILHHWAVSASLSLGVAEEENWSYGIKKRTVRVLCSYDRCFIRRRVCQARPHVRSAWWGRRNEWWVHRLPRKHCAGCHLPLTSWGKGWLQMSWQVGRKALNSANSTYRRWRWDSHPRSR